MGVIKTEGERLFEEYLKLYGYSYGYEERVAGKNKVLDFRINLKTGDRF